jgi:hypothetical protein
MAGTAAADGICGRMKRRRYACDASNGATVTWKEDAAMPVGRAMAQFMVER